MDNDRRDSAALAGTSVEASDILAMDDCEAAMALALYMAHRLHEAYPGDTPIILGEVERMYEESDDPLEMEWLLHFGAELTKIL